jgi:nucleoside-diphosphate-sugar epimerase
MSNILVIGAVGQIGTELTMELRKRHGGSSVVAATRKTPFPQEMEESGPCIYFDVQDKEALKKVVKEHSIDTIYQLAGLLSATGEQNPDLAFSINLLGLKNTLDVCRECSVKKIFWPSSIAAFGTTTPRDMTPQRTVLEPTTMYGVTKVAGELLLQYYGKKYGLDCRSIRYPGLISYKAEPGGGTTDYAVAIFYEAIRHRKYTCFVGPQTVLPMMYMPDAIRGTIELMDAPRAKLTVATSYNFAAISFSAQELAAEVARIMPGFTCDYKPDQRQAIADSWPKSIDDSQARADWNWRHKYGLKEMSEDMVKNLRPILEKKK